MAIVTYRKTDTTKLSENFTVSEFACHGNGCCSTVKIDDDLVEYLQKIRNHFGKSVIVSSGYRCEKHNKRVGGVSASRHMRGMAADIVIKGVAPAEIAKYAESIGVKGIGLYETSKDGHFVHIDTRTNKYFWYGQSQAYRSTFGGRPAASNAEMYELDDFVKDVQKACGAKVDGIAGSETLSKTVTLSAHKNHDHAAIKAIQKRLRALGYAEVGTADGIAGPKFTSAVAHFQQDNGCSVDGEITATKTTWKKLLGLK